jgi:hypothetical protein
MTGYTKLFDTLLTSTVWDLDSDTCKVWITLLALKDRDGIVTSSVPGLAHMSRVPVEKTREALDVFLKPDPDSTTPAHEGRRIEAVVGGWRLLNHDKYRDLMSADEQREKRAERQQRWRDKKKNVDDDVDACRHQETPVDARRHKRPHTYTDTCHTSPRDSLPSEALELAEMLRGRMLKRKPTHRVGKLTTSQWETKREAWARDIDRAHRIDGRSWELIGEVIEWVADHHFWAKNIESGAKLRKQFDRLEEEMGGDNSNFIPGDCAGDPSDWEVPT